MADDEKFQQWCREVDEWMNRHIGQPEELWKAAIQKAGYKSCVISRDGVGNFSEQASKYDPTRIIMVIEKQKVVRGYRG